MNMAVKITLEDLQGVMEDLQKQLTDMNMKTKIDVAARLRAASKTADLINELIKDDIKKHLKGKPGMVNGEIFKAMLQVVETTRLNQDKLKAEYPGAYQKCCETKGQKRITFEVR